MSHLATWCSCKLDRAYRYLDVLGLLWEKQISEEQLQHLERSIPEVLADLERLLPSWELDINR